jgi:hypothetical protein
MDLNQELFEDEYKEYIEEHQISDLDIDPNKIKENQDKLLKEFQTLKEEDIPF